MQNITELIAKPATQRPEAQAPLTQQERDVIGYFFFRLRLINPMFYEQIAPDEATERLVKREHAAMLRKLTREQVDTGLGGYKRLIAEGHPEYRFASLAQIIGVLERGGYAPDEINTGRAGIYKTAPRPALEDQTAKERRRRDGVRQCASILSMFDEDTASD